MCNSGIDIDRDGNIYHVRSGKILKHWVEDNAFSGAGHHIELNESPKPNEYDSYEWRKEMIKKATEQYNCKECESYIPLRWGDFWCYENYTGAKRWEHIVAYAQSQGLCFSSSIPDRRMYVEKIKDGYEIFPKQCEIFVSKKKAIEDIYKEINEV